MQMWKNCTCLQSYLALRFHPLILFYPPLSLFKQKCFAAQGECKFKLVTYNDLPFYFPRLLLKQCCLVKSNGNVSLMQCKKSLRVLFSFRVCCVFRALINPIFFSWVDLFFFYCSRECSLGASWTN